jgi:hypothetical protein
MNRLKIAYWFGKTLYFGCGLMILLSLILLRGDQLQFAIFSWFSLGIVGAVAWFIARDKLFDAETFQLSESEGERKE